MRPTSVAQVARIIKKEEKLWVPFLAQKQFAGLARPDGSLIRDPLSVREELLIGPLRF